MPNGDGPDRDKLAAALRTYAQHSDDANTSEAFLRFLGASGAPFERASLAAHFTASAWLVSADGERVLLTHHRKLDRWLQLGGHADGDANLARAALREAQEESGITGLVVEDDIFDLDQHEIPPRVHEPAHWHYDVRYVVCATQSETFVVSDESHALAWRHVATLADDPTADQSLRRMARRWVSRTPR